MWRAWVVWCTRTYSGTEGWVELDLVGWDWRGGESSCTSSSLVMLPLRVPPPGAQRTCRSTYRCSLLLLPQPAGAVCPAGQVWQVGTLGAGVDESGGGGDRSLWLPPFPLRRACAPGRGGASRDRRLDDAAVPGGSTSKWWGEPCRLIKTVRDPRKERGTLGLLMCACR